MNFKKISWFFKRHPYLYMARFKLLSKNSSVTEIENYTYNIKNKKSDISKYFHSVNKTILIDYQGETDLDLVKHISSWLLKNINRGRGLSVPSDKALKIMLEEKGGVCSDMVQVFNNFCVLNNINVREWGVTRAPFDRDYGGHSFNEVFCRHLNKWVLIDVSYCVLFYAENSKEPLSVVEFYELLRVNKTIRYKVFDFIEDTDDEGVERNYLNVRSIPFLICNYSNKTYDTFLKYSSPIIPVFMIHFFLYIISKSYYYKFPLDDYKKIFS